MKKNDWILLTATAIYSYLFYDQNVGINCLLFTISLIALLLVRNKEVYKNKSWLLAAAGSIASAGCIAFYGNGLSFLANILSLGILSAYSMHPLTSIVISFFFSLYSICASFVFMIIDSIQRSRKTSDITDNRTTSVKLAMYLIPVFIAIVFFFMYKASNPVFDNFTKKINIDFITAGWFFFTLSGLFLMYGFFYHKTIKAIAHKDLMASNTLSYNSADASGTFIGLNIDNEKLSGIILLLLLNTLLFMVNALDVNFLWFDGTLPKDLSYSAFVHQGTGALITSIIIAILIILFYFRGNLNFHPGNKSLKRLAGLWIIQNAFMIISTAYRNGLYINEYSLTFKRIGVYIWLLLVLIGLITTFVKILKAKSNWYLFRTNGWWFYAVLVISCFINWDVMVTEFNINRAEQKHKPLDTFYLLSLSERNIPQLMKLNDSIKSQAMIDDGRMEESPLYYEADHKPALHYKIYRFLEEMQQADWQSFCIAKTKVYNELSGMVKDVKDIDLRGKYLSTLKPLDLMKNIHTLNVSNNSLKDERELVLFPELEYLFLNYNQLDTIDHFPKLDHLKVLSLSNNSIKNGSALKNAPNLISLDLSVNSWFDLNTLPVFKKLTTLNLSDNNTTDYTALKNQPELRDLNISGTVINKGTKIPSLSKLLRLNLQNTRLDTADVDIFQSISSFSSLEYLNLSNNSLENLYSVTNYFNLKQAVKLGEPIQPLFPALKSLDVSRNKIQTLYPLIAYRNLEELYLSDNQLHDFSTLAQLTNLKRLSLLHCWITNLDFLKSMEALEVLDISGNPIQNYSVLFGLENLKQLTVEIADKPLVERLKKALPRTHIVNVSAEGTSGRN
ncbi:MAG: DUF4153 domain-containing protein [Bacteroidota bacterium]